MSLNFGISFDELSYHDSPEVFEFASANLKKVSRLMKKAMAAVETFRWVGDLFPSIPAGYPSVSLFGKEIFGGVVVDPNPVFIPSFVANIGIVDPGKRSLRTISTAQLRPSPTAATSTLYLHEFQSTVDISPYIVLMMQAGCKDLYVSCNVRGFPPMSLCFSSDEFISVETLDPEFDNTSCSLAEFIIANPGSEEASVYIRHESSIAHVPLTSAKVVSCPVNQEVEPAFLGGVKGGWVTCDYGYYVFRIFLSNWQMDRFPMSDWTMFSIVSVLGNKYVVTGMTIDQYEKFKISNKKLSFRETGCTAIEACHTGNGFSCSPVETYRQFDARVGGQYYSTNNYSFEDYQKAYTWYPHVHPFYRDSSFSHATLPCGICPQASGKSKKKYQSRLRDIKNFNYGVVANSSLCGSVFGQVLVTKPSYGFVLLKYKSMEMVPYLIDSLDFSPSLCGCSFGEDCAQCMISPVSNLDDVLSTGYVSSLTYWTDRFKLVTIGGQVYLFGDFSLAMHRSSTSGVDNPSREFVRRISQTRSDVYQFMISSMASYVGSKSLDPQSFITRSTVKNGDNNWYEERFAIAISSIYRSPPNGRFTAIWYVVRSFFGDYFPAVTLNFDLASRELMMLLYVMDQVDDRYTGGASCSTDDILKFRKVLSDLK